MTKIKKQVEAQSQPAPAADAVGTSDAAEQAATGEGAGQALRETDGSSVEREAPAIEPQAAPPAPAKPPVPVPAPELPPPPQPDPIVATVDVLVLCTGNVAGNRYEAGTVLEGVPSDVAKTYAGMLDAHPDAAFYARAHGAAVSTYEG